MSDHLASRGIIALMLSLDKQNEWRERYRRERPSWRPATELYASLVRSYLQPGVRVLDLGCGRGGLVEQLDVPLAQIVGIDPDWQSLAEHRLALPRLQGESDWLPFAPQSFDVIFASWVLEHVERPQLTLSSIHRVLRPGGVFIFITPNGQHPLAHINRMFGRLGQLQGVLVETLYKRTADDTFTTHYRANSAQQLDRLCLQTGLTRHVLHTVPDPTYLAFNPLMYRLSCQIEEILPQRRKIHLVGVLMKG